MGDFTSKLVGQLKDDVKDLQNKAKTAGVGDHDTLLAVRSRVAQPSEMHRNSLALSNCRSPGETCAVEAAQNCTFFVFVQTLLVARHDRRELNGCRRQSALAMSFWRLRNMSTSITS